MAKSKKHKKYEKVIVQEMQIHHNYYTALKSDPRQEAYEEAQKYPGAVGPNIDPPTPGFRD